MSRQSGKSSDQVIRLFLCGDVMTGRGVDQIMAQPGDPELHEQWARSATQYVELAERRSGPIPRSVAPGYIWGDALAVLDQAGPDVRIINLETAVTDRGSPWPDKGIHYRMHPANVDCLLAAGVDVAVLSNNHAMDWGVPGLEQTLAVLDSVGVQVAGAGRNEEEAWRPAVTGIGDGRVAVLGVGSVSSGIPIEWAAHGPAPGVALLTRLDHRAVDHIASILAESTKGADVVVVSVHWGPNWGYRIPTAHRRFAHDLIERAGVDVVHGHSTHHPLGIEVYRERPIIYGCGDLLTDYEGIRGHEHYRGELGALYLASMEGRTGALRHLELAPTKVERFQLVSPSPEAVRWLSETLDREGAPLGTRVIPAEDRRLVVGW